MSIGRRFLLSCALVAALAAGVLMGIAVVDHLVLGDMRYYSFKESRQL